LTTAGSGVTTQTLIVNDRGIYVGHLTTGLAANAYISDTDGQIRRSTSARKYKQDIEDLILDPAMVLALKPRTWRDRGMVEEDPDTTLRIPGFIAEEVEEAGLGMFVTYKEGTPEGLAYDRISAAHNIVLNDHDARLASLEEENRRLRALVEGK
jgi:hypothetical protein